MVQEDITVSCVDDIFIAVKKARLNKEWCLNFFDNEKRYICSFDNNNDDETNEQIMDDYKLRQLIYETVDCSLQFGNDFDIG